MKSVLIFGGSHFKQPLWGTDFFTKFDCVAILMGNKFIIAHSCLFYEQTGSSFCDIVICSQFPKKCEFIDSLAKKKFSVTHAENQQKINEEWVYFCSTKAKKKHPWNVQTTKILIQPFISSFSFFGAVKWTRN